MTLAIFATKAGFKLISCGPGWGGKYGYTTTDHPNCRVCGFKNKHEAQEAWLKDTFGETAGAAVLELLAKPHGEKNR